MTAQRVDLAINPETLVSHWTCEECELSHRMTSGPVKASELMAAAQAEPEHFHCQSTSCSHLLCATCSVWENGTVDEPFHWECHECKCVNDLESICSCCSHEVCFDCALLNEDYSRQGGQIELSDEDEDEDEDEEEGEREKEEKEA